MFKPALPLVETNSVEFPPDGDDPRLPGNWRAMMQMCGRRGEGATVRPPAGMREDRAGGRETLHIMENCGPYPWPSQIS